MTRELDPKLVIAATVIVVASLTSFVVLVVNGYAADAATLPIFLGALVPVFASHAQLKKVASDTNDKVTHALNGGLTDTVRKVVRTELTTMAARDEKSGTSMLEDAAANLSTPGVPSQPPDRP